MCQVLLTKSERIKSFFGDKENIDIERRYFFEFNKVSAEIPDLPSDCELRTIDAEILKNGRENYTVFFLEQRK